MKIKAIEQYPDAGAPNSVGYRLVVLSDDGTTGEIELTQHIHDIVQAAIAAHGKSFHGQ